jgi:hypothetical protein
MNRPGLILYNSHDLRARGYAAATRAEAKSFELPPFCPADDFRFLPLHIQVMFERYPVGVNGTEEMIHKLKS